MLIATKTFRLFRQLFKNGLNFRAALIPLKAQSGTGYRASGHKQYPKYIIIHMFLSLCSYEIQRKDLLKFKITNTKSTKLLLKHIPICKSVVVMFGYTKLIFCLIKKSVVHKIYVSVDDLNLITVLKAVTM